MLRRSSHRPLVVSQWQEAFTLHIQAQPYKLAYSENCRSLLLVT